MSRLFLHHLWARSWPLPAEHSLLHFQENTAQGGIMAKTVKYYLKPWWIWKKLCLLTVHLLASLPPLSEKNPIPFHLYSEPLKSNNSWVVQQITTACWWHHSWIHFVLSLRLHCSANIAFTHYPIEIMAPEVSYQYMPFPAFHSLICPGTSCFLLCENVIFPLWFQVESVWVGQSKMLLSLNCCTPLSEYSVDSYKKEFPFRKILCSSLFGYTFDSCSR